MSDNTEYLHIYYTKEEDGWYIINGDTSYDLSEWTKEEAEADYKSWDNYVSNRVAEMEAYGFYD